MSIAGMSTLCPHPVTHTVDSGDVDTVWIAGIWTQCGSRDVHTVWIAGMWTQSR